ncbi:heavy metal-associated isoprenylated plant protein 3-like [Impatiens glandulifera]|uniref:heavy metal-associated isoprenylated plant protein 3-like n=1 Tax=Impatiens glandulifera TaxID=253017 RepID=UPI001FB10315|nr:heavy metal-associated isoprenylated plant protein 3-like [Impatiens glandulifera]
MGANKNKSDDGGKKNDDLVVLKMDLHCSGCITKCKKVLGSLEGFVSLKADLESNKISIVGKVDPVKAKEILEQRMKKNVEIISPAPPKKKENGGEDKKKSEEKTEKKADDNKAKEPPLITAVLRLNLHCEGCIQKIYKTVTKTEGFHEIKFDREKELVMVKGTMEMKMLAETLEGKLKRNVEVLILPKKETAGGAGAGAGENKEKGGGGEKDKAGPKVGEHQVQFSPVNYGYGYGYPYGYPPVTGYPTTNRYTAPNPGGWGNYQNPPGFAFSDENPNACFIM